MSSWAPIKEIAKKVSSGQLRAADLVEQSLKTIEANKQYQAVIATVNDRARQRAKEIDQQIKQGAKVGRLAGVPFIAKDNFLTFGSQTTAASNILKGFEAPYQATAVEKLEAEGAICVAKANLDAFGHGVSTEHSDLMTTKNPRDPAHVPGGSSGGSAAAVVLDMAPFALGTDTGGSNRLPASFSGCFGYKPTYGLVSRSGVVAMASSTDTIGVLANKSEDIGVVLDVMAGTDVLDSTSIERDKSGYQLDVSELDLSHIKVGLIKEYLGEGVDQSVKQVINQTIEKLKQAKVDIQEISLPSLDLALASYYIIVPAEISSNLSRYDGQHYGYSSNKAKNLQDSYNWSRSEGFGNEAKRRIMIGTYVLSSGYYDAYYKKAQMVRTKLIQEFAQAFQKVDFLIGPVAPTTAFKVGQKVDDPLQMYLIDIMTVAANLVGIPAISIPAGVSPQNKLPIGLQVMADNRQDRQLLQMASQIEELLR